MKNKFICKSNRSAFVRNGRKCISPPLHLRPMTTVLVLPPLLRTSYGLYIPLFRNGGRSWKNFKYQFPGKVHHHLKAAMVEQVHGGSHSRSCSITAMNPLLLLKNKIKISRFHLIGILRMPYTVCCIGWQLLREIWWDVIWKEFLSLMPTASVKEILARSLKAYHFELCRHTSHRPSARNWTSEYLSELWRAFRTLTCFHQIL